MREEIYEECSIIQNPKVASLKYSIISILGIISFTVAGFMAIIFFMLYDYNKGSLILNLLMTLLPVALFITVGVLLTKFKKRFYVDYDYILVSGSIRFSKVIKNKKRIFISIFDCKNIDCIGKFGSRTFLKYVQMQDIKKLVLSSNEIPTPGTDFFYLVVSANSVRTLYILECSEKFIKAILQYSRRGVLEEDYKWYTWIMLRQQNHLLTH